MRAGLDLRLRQFQMNSHTKLIWVAVKVKGTFFDKENPLRKSRSEHMADAKAVPRQCLIEMPERRHAGRVFWRGCHLRQACKACSRRSERSGSASSIQPTDFCHFEAAVGVSENQGTRLDNKEYNLLVSTLMPPIYGNHSASFVQGLA